MTAAAELLPCEKLTRMYTLGLLSTATYRIGDNDARCGPASIQRFDGEDLAAAERSQAQHQQCYDWWEAQRAQHEAQKAAQAELTLREQEAVSFRDIKIYHFIITCA